MSASLSITTVSMAPAGSWFSSESAPRPFHHRIRRRGGAIFWAALPSDYSAGRMTWRPTEGCGRRAKDISPATLDDVPFAIRFCSSMYHGLHRPTLLIFEDVSIVVRNVGWQ